MKKFLKILLIIVIAVPVLVYGYLLYSTEARHAAATAEAVALLESDAAVEVIHDDWGVVMRPADSSPGQGLILYNGANCDPVGYVTVLHDIAEAGYLVVIPYLPFDFAIFAPNKADEVMAKFPEIEEWVLAGHSMGGAMAGRYAYFNPDRIEGLILWDAYPPETNSLAESELPVWHVHRATPDGTPSRVFLDTQQWYPPDSVWVPIPGGMHMYFGSFDGGAYEEEWEPGIERDVQQDMVRRATLAALERMF